MAGKAQTTAARPSHGGTWPLGSLVPNPLNPRTVRDDDPALDELAQSIRQVGLLQPIVITPAGVIIAGHRRAAACRLAALDPVPVVVRDLDEAGQLAAMLAENVARRALNPLETARACRGLADRGAAAEAIVAGAPNPPAIVHGGAVAAYNPVADRIRIPDAEAFESAAHYYATLFHELGHATGHGSRLNRPAVGGAASVPPFGSADYSAEELVAELTSAFLCGEAGIAPATIDNAAAYVAGWLKVLTSDKRAIIFAGAQAQKAADYLLDRRAATEAVDSDDAAVA